MRIDGDKLYSVRELASLLGSDRDVVITLAREHGVQRWRAGRAVVFDRLGMERLRSLLENHRVKAVP